MNHRGSPDFTPRSASNSLALERFRVDGREVANPTGQYENSSITQLVVGRDITSRFALQINVPIIYREFKRPEGFAIDRGTVAGLGDMSILLKTVAFHYSSPARRSFEFEGKNPVAIEHEPDFTASAVLITGLKLPTGATSRLKEEFHEVEVPGAPISGIHGHDLTLGTGRMTVFSESKRPFAIRTCFSRRMCSSLCAAMARINIISPTISPGAPGPAITLSVVPTRSSACNSSFPANTKMSIDSVARKPMTLA